MPVKRCFVSCLVACLLTPYAAAQTTISGGSLSMKSLNSSFLTENGYVGTYIDVASDGDDVTIGVNASGTAFGGIDPHMNIVLADYSAGWEVGSTANDYQHTFTDMPAGRYFLRTEFNNDMEHSPRELSVNSLTVTGATVNNTFSNSANNAHAIAAANTYINNFRKGDVTVSLPGLSPGTQVDVSLKNHAFNFGTAVPGTSGSDVNTYLGNSGNPNSTAFKFQQALAESKFNALVPENVGKWGSQEGSRDAPDLSGVDTILDFAESHNMRARMHNLVWGSQQPGWVGTMYNNPNGSDNYNSFFNPQGTNLQNRDALYSDQLAPGGTPSAGEPSEVHERIDYYVRDRAQRYYELDVYNESVHTPQYWNVYGASGIADLYNEVAQAVADAGGDARLFTNEYNVLQDSPDGYGNWYKQNIEQILAEGGAVSGIGIQSYENDAIGTGDNAHFVARKMRTLQNLSVLGMPITLTEFGVKKEPGEDTSEADATIMLDDTARLVFGTPNANGFFMWGFWSGNIYRGGAALYDQNWNLREPGERWLDLMSIDGDGDPNDDWDTQLTATVGPDGTIQFDGFWGDYELSIGGETYDLELIKGTTDYLLAIGPVLAGDYNGNGIIDAADFTKWRDAVAAGATSLLNDPTPGAVDQTDFDYWRAHFGETLGSGAGNALSAAAVPEPAGAVLLLLGALLLAGARRRCIRTD